MRTWHSPKRSEAQHLGQRDNGRSKARSRGAKLITALWKKFVVVASNLAQERAIPLRLTKTCKTSAENVLATQSHCHALALLEGKPGIFSVSHKRLSAFSLSSGTWLFVLSNTTRLLRTDIVSQS